MFFFKLVTFWKFMVCEIFALFKPKFLGSSSVESVEYESCFSCSRSQSVDATNPGNNLYVTGLSTRVTSTDVEKFFNKEGKV